MLIWIRSLCKGGSQDVFHGHFWMCWYHNVSHIFLVVESCMRKWQGCWNSEHNYGGMVGCGQVIVVWWNSTTNGDESWYGKSSNSSGVTQELLPVTQPLRKTLDAPKSKKRWRWADMLKSNAYLVLISVWPVLDFHWFTGLKHQRNARHWYFCTFRAIISLMPWGNLT